jgi:hypothetical protein
MRERRGVVFGVCARMVRYLGTSTSAALIGAQSDAQGRGKWAAAACDLSQIKHFGAFGNSACRSPGTVRT